MTKENKHGLKAILVPTDFSESSDVALGIAIDLAKQQNAHIYLLHVHKFRRNAGKNEMIQGQIAKFPEARAVEIIPVIREGKPYKEIMKTQAEKHVDLIIIARHKDRESPYIHFQSTTEKIKKRAQCSVLVVGV